MKLIKPILIFLLFFLIVTFSIQNMEEVTSQYYGVVKELTLPFAIVLLVVLFLGIIIGGIGGIVSNTKLRMELWRQKKKRRGLEKNWSHWRARRLNLRSVHHLLPPQSPERKNALQKQSEQIEGR